MARLASGTVPPAIDLGGAIRIVKLLYDQGGSSMHPDDLATSLNSTVKSGAFKMKLVALRAFGLVRTAQGPVALTPCGSTIAAPSSDDEYREAVFTAFNSLPLHRAIHERYRGGYLPEDTFLANIFQREHRVSPEQKGKWVECFKKSGRVAGILKDEGGKIRVLQSPSLPSPSANGNSTVVQDREMPIRNEEVAKSDALATLPPHSVRERRDFVPIVLDEARSVLIPADFDRGDLDYLKGVLDLYVARRETRKKQAGGD